MSDMSTKGDSQKSNGTESQINDNEWGEFLHLPGEKFYDFGKIRAEIVRDTEAKTGKNAGEACSGYKSLFGLIMAIT